MSSVAGVVPEPTFTSVAFPIRDTPCERPSFKVPPFTTTRPGRTSKGISQRGHDHRPDIGRRAELNARPFKNRVPGSRTRQSQSLAGRRLERRGSAGATKSELLSVAVTVDSNVAVTPANCKIPEPSAEALPIETSPPTIDVLPE